MSEHIKSTAGKVAPWRKNIAWWLVLLEGIILAAIGVYALIDAEGAKVVLAQIAAVYLLIAGALQVYASMRGRAVEEASGLLLARGAIGAISGLLILLLTLTKVVSIETGGWIVALGALIYGGLGIYAAILARPKVMLWGVILNSVFFIASALVIVYSLITEATIVAGFVKWVGIFALVIGVILIIYSILLYRSKKSNAAAS